MSVLSRAFPSDNLHVVDLPYRFSSWAFDEPANARLWFDADGQLVAWACLQTPFWSFDYALHPAAEPGLHRDLLAWADDRARQIVDAPSSRPAWFVNVFADQAERRRNLEA